ncbi:MAG: phosphoribosyltransferase family protein [Candidatus Saccharimonas sp.]
MNERYISLYDRKQVQQAIGRMASEITGLNIDKDPLFVSLLRGAAPFSAQLMAAIAQQAPDFHPDMDYMITSNKQDRIVPDSTQPEIKLHLDDDSDVNGRPVIVLDNVLDKGETYAFVRQGLKQMGAASVELAVLIEKEFKRTNGVKADFVGLYAPATFLVGMGMTDKAVSEEAFRWEGGIWQVRKDDDLPPQHIQPSSPLVSA